MYLKLAVIYPIRLRMRTDVLPMEKISNLIALLYFISRYVDNNYNKTDKYE